MYVLFLKREIVLYYSRYIWVKSISTISAMNMPKPCLSTEGSSLFLDALISRKEDGSVKIQVYQKKMHTDQYLHFNSNHPFNHNQGVIWTLFDRCNNIVTNTADTVKEIEYLQSVKPIAQLNTTMVYYTTWATTKRAGCNYNMLCHPL